MSTRYEEIMLPLLKKLSNPRTLAMIFSTCQQHLIKVVNIPTKTSNKTCSWWSFFVANLLLLYYQLFYKFAAGHRKSIHHCFKYFEESLQLLIGCPESTRDLKFKAPTSDASVSVHILELYSANISPKCPDSSSYQSPQKYSTCLDT